ncbi:glycosyltransferase family 4 protein [Candidatus Giovannonibacteria bacterium]|nr:glycosyltransferase family 4 protein [Candidatus Giovannonibacteria bacterium]
MKIAFIHSDKKIGTGAHFINDLIACKLRERGTEVNSFYPQFLLTDTPVHFKGINNILFFYSLLEKREDILRHDIIQGTTYTPLAFLRFSKPVVSHFGSTSIGFLKAVPKTNHLENGCSDIFLRLKQFGVVRELNIKTRRPLNDIASIEQYAAERADYIIATSDVVKKDLISVGIAAEKIEIIHNAIEDYWFETPNNNPQSEPSIVFLGRIGEDPFTLKLKGVDRLIWLFERFPEVKKFSVVMSKNKKLVQWMKNKIPNHSIIANAVKDSIPSLLNPYARGIVLLTSRYEGFSLSLIEAMSQGLVPISFPVGVAPEIIRNGENGFVVSTIEEAKEKINLLLSDVNLRHRLALSAKETAKQFKSDTMIEKTLDLYKRILK